jgi:uncharacterized protein (DUF4415 family)
VGHLVRPAPKRAVSLRLDADMLERFGGAGPRYQSRMDAVLRADVEHQKRVRSEKGARGGPAGERRG